MKYNSNGLIIYRGLSMLDNITPIVVVATGLNFSSNKKTGNMIQTYIIRQDMKPTDAVKLGLDSSICGSCPYAGGQGCYVNVGHGPLSVYKAFKNNRYRTIERKDYTIFQNRALRFGTYGDPAAVPYLIWFNLMKVGKVSKYTGYTHQWRNLGENWAFLMASCDSKKDLKQANAKGWRAFEVITDITLAENTVICPASEDGGYKTTCESCGLCKGNKSKAKSISIVVHGSRKNRAKESIKKLA